jgi:hypothetical protein
MSLVAALSLPLAHLGHWWSYVLYGVPVAIVLVSVVVSFARKHRGERPRDGSAG